jgi:CPA2 family monovalent cation:H+ antiporter-2
MTGMQFFANAAVRGSELQVKALKGERGAARRGYRILIELGAAVVLLALVARLANRWSILAIPLYLVLGLCFGNGGLAPLNLSKDFTSTGAEIGVLLLLFMLGLEFTGEELRENLRKGSLAGVADFALNFSPGLLAGLLLGWDPLPAVLLGGITYISSSGIVAKILSDLKRMNNPETPGILSVLVLEDLAMAVYDSGSRWWMRLPLVGVLLVGGNRARILVSVSVAVVVVLVVLTGYWTARRLGVDRQGCMRSGLSLVPRGKSSIVIAGLGVAFEPQLGPLSAAYVLLLAILGPLLARI